MTAEVLHTTTVSISNDNSIRSKAVTTGRCSGVETPPDIGATTVGTGETGPPNF